MTDDDDMDYDSTQEHPYIEGTPGLRWRRRSHKWEAIWRARPDLVKRGFEPKNRLLFRGQELTRAEEDDLRDKCQKLQDEMLVFSRGGLPKVGTFSGTLRSLIDCYQTDSDSSYHKLRYQVRVRHNYVMKKIVEKYGDHELANLTLRDILAWHRAWMEGGKIASAHGFVGQLRTLLSFGTRLLEDEECKRLSFAMSKERFPNTRPRTERMTAEQCIAIRQMAHQMARPSIALGQALQFELMLRQKDVCGEWIPMSEPGISDITGPKGKWLRGLRWEEIDADLILRHRTSKRDKDLEVDLKLAPMVMEELSYMATVSPGKKTGAVVICETNGRPWLAGEYRRVWRDIANKAGIPKAVKNMDSRSGGITEATDAGADLEHVRHAATHSNISMTQRYSRGAAQKIAGVMQTRVEYRNKKGTEGS
jgi:hypothetical protein